MEINEVAQKIAIQQIEPIEENAIPVSTSLILYIIVIL